MHISELPTRRRSTQQNESIYNLVSGQNMLDGPRTTTHDASASDKHAPLLHKPRRMHEDSRQIDNMWNPVRGVRDAQQRNGITPTDHAKNNRRAIRDASHMNAVRKVNELHMASHDRGKYAARPAPSTTALNTQRASGDSRDFVHRNIIDAGTNRRTSQPEGDDGSEWLKKNNYGRVPAYLHERNMELAADYARQQAEKEAMLIPEGMRMMSNEERVDTLSILETNREEVMQAIARLPFVTETPSQIRNKNQLERRLLEIEEARKIFSRPKVLVKL